MRPHLPIAVSLLAAATLTPRVSAQEFVIKNGGMTQGEEVPDDWRGNFGEVQVTRDTTIFKEGPASLKVAAQNGKSGQAFQKFDGGAGKKLTVSGWLRTEGNVKAQVVVQAFAEGFKNNQFMQVRFLQGPSDWIAFEKEVTLPDWCAFFHVGLMAEGDGAAWLDEVKQGAGTVDAGKAKTLEERMTSAPPTKGKPWEPGWGFYPQFPTGWRSHFENQLARTKQGNVEVVFLGDSITQGWGDSGKAEWDKHFAPLNAANYGIGGDSTRQVIWRIDHGLLDGLTPKLVVLKIGTNNLYDDFNAGTNEEIVKGVLTAIERLQAKVPGARILLLGIMPRQNEFFSSRIVAIDEELAKLADGSKVEFLNINDRFAANPGKGEVIPDLFVADRLHLSPKGYTVFAEAIAPTVEKFAKGQ